VIIKLGKVGMKRMAPQNRKEVKQWQKQEKNKLKAIYNSFNKKKS